MRIQVKPKKTDNTVKPEPDEQVYPIKIEPRRVRSSVKKTTNMNESNAPELHEFRDGTFIKHDNEQLKSIAEESGSIDELRNALDKEIQLNKKLLMITADTANELCIKYEEIERLRADNAMLREILQKHNGGTKKSDLPSGDEIYNQVRQILEQPKKDDGL